MVTTEATTTELTKADKDDDNGDTTAAATTTEATDGDGNTVAGATTMEATTTELMTTYKDDDDGDTTAAATTTEATYDDGDTMAAATTTEAIMTESPTADKDDGNSDTTAAATTTEAMDDDGDTTAAATTTETEATTTRRKNRPKSPYKNEVATPSPGRFSPRPRVRSLIVVWLRWATGRCGQIHPPSRKLRPLSYPHPADKLIKNPQKNKAATPSPGRFSPNPVVLRLIVMLSAIATGRIV